MGVLDSKKKKKVSVFVSEMLLSEQRGIGAAQPQPPHLIPHTSNLKPWDPYPFCARVHVSFSRLISLMCWPFVQSAKKMLRERARETQVRMCVLMGG